MFWSEFIYLYFYDILDSLTSFFVSLNILWVYLCSVFFLKQLEKLQHSDVSSDIEMCFYNVQKLKAEDVYIKKFK